MLIVLSPAKSLDLDTPPTTKLHTTPDFIGRASELIDVLRGYSPGQVADLMKLSDPLAMLNVGRYASWELDHGDARQAIMAFNGDVYTGFDARTLKPKQSAMRRTMCASCRACTGCCGRWTGCARTGWRWVAG